VDPVERTKNKVAVSIVIPTLNGGKTFTECLGALFSQDTERPFEVIVLDSGSGDGTREAASRAGARLYDVGPGEFNHGETRNRGIGLARGEVVILMTQDAVPIGKNWLDSLTRPFSEDPLVAGVYARQVPREDADVLTKRHLGQWLTGRTERHVSYISDRGAYEKMRPMERYFFCNFDDVCSAIRKSVWEKIPYERTDFGEDIAWSKKALEAGFKIVFEPSASVRHSHSRSLAYEYRRTRLCHRRLFEIFGMRTVPTKRLLLRYALRSAIKDASYVWRREPSLTKRLALMARTPLMSLVNVYAQYSGALDAMRGSKNKRMPGV